MVQASELISVRCRAPLVVAALTLALCAAPTGPAFGEPPQQQCTDIPISVKLTPSTATMYTCETVTITAEATDVDQSATCLTYNDVVNTFTWNVDGGTIISTTPGQNRSVITISYAATGPKHIDVVADDVPNYLDDQPVTARVEIDVLAAPNPLIAAIAGVSATSGTGPWQQGGVDVVVGSTVHFNGACPEFPSKDQDPPSGVGNGCDLVDDQIATYVWDFGDTSATASGAQASHATPTPRLAPMSYPCGSTTSGIPSTTLRWNLRSHPRS